MDGPAYHLALYNFGLHVAPFDDPAIDGFRLREPFNFEAARRAEGFVGRSGYAGEPGPRSWGPQVFPRYIKDSGFDSAPSQLSLWRDIESLMAFSYDGVHADALKHARHWNRKQTWPPLVLWWTPAGRYPDWAEGAARLEHLDDHGPSPYAFTFKQPYDPSGAAAAIDRARIREIAARNASTQTDLLEAVKDLRV
ncbi:DUF3291 domain-containing protein [Rhizobium sp. TRM95111]|uniref:DUF3291 domain-containing protein n=1 Tax=Rhizobium alarense TaxID=2846851 RepID=UPI001F3B1077|nr:DUF3291 domain-containing protein [Rhizobium alarense]MCF3641047.1 DUF3291 domain-containing protein [Rhizobium alarense]